MKRIMIIGMLVLMSFSVSAATVSHSASEVQPGSFATGNYYFDGNVGIGTAGPNSQMEIKSSGTSNAPFTIERSSDTNNLFYFFEDTDGDAVFRGMKSDDTISWQLHSNGDSYFNVGNVGIGTTGPNKNLEISQATDGTTLRITSRQNDASHIAGGVMSALEFYSEDGSGSGARVHGSIETRATSATGGSSDLVFSSSDTADAMAITNDGNVGIGTTDPDYNLHVKSDSSFAIIQAEAASNKAVALNLYGDRGWRIINDGAGNHAGTDYFSIFDITADTSRMVIDTSGNVGIGTTEPESDLDVDGTITIDKTGMYYGQTNGNCDNQCSVNEPTGFDADSGVCLKAWTSAGVPQSCSADGGDSNQCLCVALITN